MSIGLAVLMVLVLATFALAQTPEATETTTPPAAVGCPYGNFTDEDGDGVCDYRDNEAAGQQGGRSYGNGMMMQQRAYVDADGDGVCDNCDGTMSHRHGRWNRQGMGGGQMNSTGRPMMGRGWNR
jgi:hypothetical protein